MNHHVGAEIDMKLPNPYGGEEVTEKHQKRYLRYYKQSPGTVLEIGCGRGAMLTLLKDAGIPSYGLDSSEVSVTYCREKDLNVVQGDALQHLKTLETASLGGIFCAHMIEHLEPNNVIELIREAHRVIKTGGTFIIITPNARDLRTTERFWLDITHVRPYPEKLVKALLVTEGFTNIIIREDTEPSKNVLERMLKYLLRLWFMGFMFRGDLVVIAIR
jgi:SAM-dependent methyltransferase